MPSGPATSRCRSGAPASRRRCGWCTRQSSSSVPGWSCVAGRSCCRRGTRWGCSRPSHRPPPCCTRTDSRHLGWWRRPGRTRSWPGPRVNGRTGSRGTSWRPAGSPRNASAAGRLRTAAGSGRRPGDVCPSCRRWHRRCRRRCGWAPCESGRWWRTGHRFRRAGRWHRARCRCARTGPCSGRCRYR